MEKVKLPLVKQTEPKDFGDLDRAFELGAESQRDADADARDDEMDILQEENAKLKERNDELEKQGKIDYTELRALAIATGTTKGRVMEQVLPLFNKLNDTKQDALYLSQKLVEADAKLKALRERELTPQEAKNCLSWIQCGYGLCCDCDHTNCQSYETVAKLKVQVVQEEK